jgi:hypothetical protein
MIWNIPYRSKGVMGHLGHNNIMIWDIPRSGNGIMWDYKYHPSPDNKGCLLSSNIGYLRCYSCQDIIPERNAYSIATSTSVYPGFQALLCT